MVDAVLDIAVHEGGKIVDRVVDAMIGDTSLREVVGADLGTTIACRNECLAPVGNVIDIFLVLLVVDVGTQTREGTLLVLRLVTCLGTFNQNLIDNARVGILPHVAQTHTRLNLIDVLSTGS